MKIFPSHNYKVELNEDFDISILNLKQQTLESNKLYSQVTDKKFIGVINENNFKIIGSEIGIGAFAVFIGSFNEKKGTILIRINSAFKVLISILYFLPVGAVVWTVIDFGILKSIGLIVPLVMGFLLIRFVLTGLFYKFSSNMTMENLKKSLGIKFIQKVD